MKSKTDRQEKICSLLAERRFVTVKELSETLFISESSIRRDLAVLESKGFLKRSHGGAHTLHAGDTVVPFGIRAHRGIAAKQAMAKKAVSLIQNGDIVFLDQTSTCYHLAVEIAKQKAVTVVTNNREILNLLADSDISVVFSGGIVSRANTNCLVGQSACRSFEDIYADVAFFSVKSLSHEGVVSDCSQDEVFVRNAMLRSAKKKVLLCDATKIGTRSAYRQCTLNEVDFLISDDENTAQFRQVFVNLEVL